MRGWFFLFFSSPGKARAWKLPLSLGNSVSSSGDGGRTSSNRGSSSGDSSSSGSNIGDGNGSGVQTKSSGNGGSSSSTISSSTTIRSSSCSGGGSSGGGDAALTDLGASVRFYFEEKSKERVSFFLVS